MVTLKHVRNMHLKTFWHEGAHMRVLKPRASKGYEIYFIYAQVVIHVTDLSNGVPKISFACLPFMLHKAVPMNV